MGYTKPYERGRRPLKPLRGLTEWNRNPLVTTSVAASVGSPRQRPRQPGGIGNAKIELSRESGARIADDTSEYLAFENPDRVVVYGIHFCGCGH